MARRPFYAALAVLIGILLLEGAVRTRAFLKHGSARVTVFSLAEDPATGLQIPEPGSVVGEIVVNSAGFRSPEIPLARPPRTLRLAFVGASTTFCAEVSSNADTWPALVLDELRATCPDTDFDYLNAGVPGYTTKQSLLNLRARVLPYDPDVVVAYEGTNDLVHESRRIAVERGLIDADDGAPGWLGEHWMTLNLVAKNLRYRKLQRALERSGGGVQLPPGAIYGPFAESLGALLDCARDSGALTAVATFSTQLRAGQQGEERVQAASSAKYYMPYLDAEGILAGYAEINAAIRAVAAERPDVLLIEGEDSIPPDDEHFVDTIHFRDAGSAAQAKRVGAALLAAPAFRALLEQRRRSS
jgi:lysophospholipase L1-like esterase